MMTAPTPAQPAGSFRIMIVHDAEPLVFAQRMANLLAGASQLGHIVSVMGTGIGPLSLGGPIEHWAHVSLHLAPASARKPVEEPENVSMGVIREADGYAA